MKFRRTPLAFLMLMSCVVAFASVAMAEGDDPGTLRITLTTTSVGVPGDVEEGMVSLVVANEDAIPLGIEMVWPEVDQRLIAMIDPAEERDISFVLAAGEYVLRLLEGPDVYAGVEVPLIVTRSDDVAAGPGAALDADRDEAEVAVLMDLGREVYAAHCASCHLTDGSGDIGVPLAGNTFLDDTRFVISQIVHGGGFMPAFPNLPDEEVAAVATYIRMSWGNDFGPVTVDEVGAVR